jgi:hypothetical protein
MNPMRVALLRVNAVLSTLLDALKRKDPDEQEQRPAARASPPTLIPSFSIDDFRRERLQRLARRPAARM